MGQRRKGAISDRTGDGGLREISPSCGRAALFRAYSEQVDTCANADRHGQKIPDIPMMPAPWLTSPDRRPCDGADHDLRCSKSGASPRLEMSLILVPGADRPVPADPAPRQGRLHGRNLALRAQSS